MRSLIIKQGAEVLESLIEQLVIDKDAVSAVYSEAEREVTDETIKIPGSLVLLMNSGKEFRFKYRFHNLASISCILLTQAIQVESAVEVTI